MKKIFGWLTDTRAQAVLEAALIIPVLLFLIAGIFVVGFWFNATLTATAAAREGARSAALTGDCGSIIAGVKKTMDVIDEDPRGERIHILVAPDPLPLTGHDVTLQVEYDVPIVFAFFKNFYDNASSTYPFITARAEASARMEVDPAHAQESCST